MKVRPALPLLALVAGLLASASSPRPVHARQPGAAQAASTASTAGPLYHALVIGNDDYASLPKLGTAVRDARSIARGRAIRASSFTCGFG